jgi:predicted ArsR family transcriptional regulator
MASAWTPEPLNAVPAGAGRVPWARFVKQAVTPAPDPEREPQSVAGTAMADDPQRKRRPTEPGGEVVLNAEDFFGDIVALLAENMEETFGLEDSASFVAAVGGTIGGEISRKYAAGRPLDRTERAEVIAAVCVDLKARIGGAFRVESIEDDRIVFLNTRCPFADRVVGRPSLCMMTTNVFGRVAADRAGYASVQIEQAIALGDPVCRVVVSLVRDEEAGEHEFFG